MSPSEPPEQEGPAPAGAADPAASALGDVLTGLFSRKHLDHVLPALLDVALREQQPLALAMIDLDQFNSVNDRHGRSAGDTMLTSFGELLTSQQRPGDVACRFGGEEFCLLLPNTDAHTARRRLNALLTWWRGVEFHFDADTSTGNAFSAGVADSFLAPGAAAELLGAAQACLAEAKRLGRNRVLVFDALAGTTEAPE